MTEVQEKPTLVYNDETYVIEDLSDTAKYIIGQIQDLNNQLSATRGRLDQLEVAKRGFTDMLGEELKKEEGAEQPLFYEKIIRFITTG